MTDLLRSLTLSELVEQYLNKEIPLDEFVTHHYKLNEINDAFQCLRDGKCIRAVVHF